ncbi:hypothetical protein JBE04_14770 [Streptomyces sp. PRKS01-29]|nr:hypothetical protein [Streptomyces sabulosicollis]MBI0295694.1 hypothetical protein [Streptomyces sabulosicollis]
MTHDVKNRENVARALAADLPIAARVTSVDLVVFDGTRWEGRASFALR